MSALAFLADALRRDWQRGQEQAQEINQTLNQPQQGSALGRKVREINEEYPLPSLLVDFLPVAGDIKGAVDQYAYTRPDAEVADGFWAALGGIRQARAAGKIIRSGLDVLDELPEGGFKAMLQDLLDEQRLTLDDIKRMFTDEGDLIVHHGTSGTDIPHFTTRETQALLGSNTDLWAGPGLYTEVGGLASPIEIGGIGLSADEPQAIYDLAFQREEIPRLIAKDFVHDFPKWKFQDQTDEVKDIIRSLYPNLDDDEAFRVWQKSAMSSDRPFAMSATQEAYISGNAPLEELGYVAPEPTIISEPQVLDIDAKQAQPLAHQRLLAAGLRGNVHMDRGRLTATIADPDYTHVLREEIAPSKAWKRARDETQATFKNSPAIQAPPHQVKGFVPTEPIPGAGGHRFATPEVATQLQIQPYVKQLKGQPKWKQFIKMKELKKDPELRKAFDAYKKANPNAFSGNYFSTFNMPSSGVYDYFDSPDWAIDSALEKLLTNSRFKSGDLSSADIVNFRDDISLPFRHQPNEVRQLVRELELPEETLKGLRTADEVAESMKAKLKGRLSLDSLDDMSKDELDELNNYIHKHFDEIYDVFYLKIFSHKYSGVLGDEFNDLQGRILNRRYLRD